MITISEINEWQRIILNCKTDSQSLAFLGSLNNKFNAITLALGSVEDTSSAIESRDHYYSFLINSVTFLFREKHHKALTYLFKADNFSTYRYILSSSNLLPSSDIFYFLDKNCIEASDFLYYVTNTDFNDFPSHPVTNLFHTHSCLGDGFKDDKKEIVRSVVRDSLKYIKCNNFEGDNLLDDLIINLSSLIYMDDTPFFVMEMCYLLKLDYLPVLKKSFFYHCEIVSDATRECHAISDNDSFVAYAFRHGHIHLLPFSFLHDVMKRRPELFS